MGTRLIIDKVGRIVIPKPLREELHLGPGDTLEMESSGEQIMLRPVRGTGPLTKEPIRESRSPRRRPIACWSVREERDRANLATDE